MSDWAAAFLSRWTRRIAVTAISTYTVTEIAVMFGMYATAHDALLKLFALVVHGMLVVAILQACAPVATLIRARQGMDSASPGVSARCPGSARATWAAASFPPPR